MVIFPLLGKCIVSTIEPFVTLATAVAVLAEPVTVNALLGGPVVLLGVWLMGRHRRRG